ncbi:hypothetical protein DAPPUDRAFT_119060, partial [Daphnia pulex]
MTYEINVDGKKIVAPVLASPDELYKQTSLDSLVGLGIYFGHDADTSTLDNAIGIVLAVDVEESYRLDTPELRYVYDEYDRRYPIPDTTDGILGHTKYAKLTLGFFNQADVDRIDAGERELSAGYDAQIIEKAGIWYGTPYQYVKQNITYDHSAVLPQNTARG